MIWNPFLQARWNIVSKNKTEKLQTTCIQLEIHFQNLEYEVANDTLIYIALSVPNASSAAIATKVIGRLERHAQSWSLILTAFVLIGYTFFLLQCAGRLKTSESDVYRRLKSIPALWWLIYTLLTI